MKLKVKKYYLKLSEQYESQGLEMPKDKAERIKSARREYERRKRLDDKRYLDDYIVLFKEDAQRYLSPQLLQQLNQIIDVIITGRQADGQPPLEKRW